MEESADQSNELTVQCPLCGETLGHSDECPAQCPRCGIALLSRETETELQAPVDDVAASKEDDELSALRIRQISAMRRGAYRERSHCIIGIVVLIVAALKLILMTIQSVRTSGWRLLSGALVFGAVVSLMISWWLAGRVIALTRELKRPLLPDPIEPPDFSTLSDGSQHARHLEEM